MCERQRQTQGTNAPGCVGAAQPLGSDVRGHGEGRRRPHGAARVGDPHRAWSAFRELRKAKRQNILGLLAGNRILNLYFAGLRPVREPEAVATVRAAVGRAGSFNPEGQSSFRFQPFGSSLRKERLRSLRIYCRRPDRLSVSVRRTGINGE